VARCLQRVTRFGPDRQLCYGGIRTVDVSSGSKLTAQSVRPDGGFGHEAAASLAPTNGC
jgi:hypothetical protein